MQIQSRKPILCLDFDGVCHSYTSGWQSATEIPDPPVPGLFEFLEEAQDRFDIQIFSSRSHQEGGVEAMSAWFHHHHRAWRTATGSRGTLPVEFPAVKPPAMLTIDDRALLFEGTWPDIDTLLAFKPWNKKDPL